MTASSRGGGGGGPGARAPGAGLPRLHVIVGDEVLAAPDFGERLEGLVGAGGSRLAVHLRAREMSAARLFAAARVAVEVGAAAGSTIVVNDRLDVALAVGAGGVQLREDSMDPDGVAEVMGVVGTGRPLLVGRSIHSPRQAGTLAGGRVDYLVLGSVYETQSHPDGRPIGPRAVAAAATTADIPVLAIGGVGVGEVAGLLTLGAHGVVVKSGVWGAPDPPEAVLRYLETLHPEG